MRILIATSNSAKVIEFHQMLGTEAAEWLDLTNFPSIPPIEETGSTFRANACLKASGYARHFNVWALADDSGLEVDALDKNPGVHSARWAMLHNAGQGDAANNRLLLKQLEHVADDERGARFVCVLALADPSGRIVLTTRDTVEGRVLREARGANGFGYDPLFLIPSVGQTSAELSSEEKHRISHRGGALRSMRTLMSQVWFADAADPSAHAGD